ncbi:MAG: hypothetical protein Q8P31_03325 [Bacillota bacterium]|nr:hypothetical protein [Bacillota bacterium]
MTRGRAIVAIVMLLTLLMAWDVQANRDDFINSWQDGFAAEMPHPGTFKEAAKQGQVVQAAGAARELIVCANVGSIIIRGVETDEISAAYSYAVQTDTDAQANRYLEQLAVRFVEGADDSIVLEFAEPMVRPTYAHSVTCDLEIEVPSHMSVAIESWSTLQITDIHGGVRATGEGGATAERIGGDLSLHTAYGHLTVSHIGGSADLSNPGGQSTSVSAVAGDLKLQASHELGTVEVRGVGGNCDVMTLGPVTRISEVQGETRVQGQSHFNLARPAGAVVADVHGGSLTVTGLKGSLKASGTKTLMKLELAPEAGFEVKADLRMSSFFSDYTLDTKSGLMQQEMDISGTIGDGANPLEVTLHAGTLEIRKAGS